MRLRLGQLASFAAALDLDLDRDGTCLACLSFVSSCLREGDEREARVWVRRVTPTLWIEGMDRPALRAVRKAARAGVRHGEECLADLEERGGFSVVARAIVLRLGGELAERERVEFEIYRRGLPPLELARPELN
ncbi:MAG TPA: hypothetical protein VFJ77_10265 [Gaiellaceae bacterium]|nr:hypothetical protein [Gaiellaceae bacterium]